jgi:hypothetical protein
MLRPSSGVQRIPDNHRRATRVAVEKGHYPMVASTVLRAAVHDSCTPDIAQICLLTVLLAVCLEFGGVPSFDFGVNIFSEGLFHRTNEQIVGDSSSSETSTIEGTHECNKL